MTLVKLKKTFRHLTLVNLSIFVKIIFNAIVQMYFKASKNGSLVLRCMIHVTHIFVELLFNWSDCRSYFWSIHMTLEKVSLFKKKIHCYRPNVLLKFFRMVERFYGLWYTLVWFLLNIKVEPLQITVLKWSRELISIFKRRFLCYYLNAFQSFSE